MNVALVVINDKKDSQMIDDPMVIPPLNLMYLSEILRRAGHNPKIIDALAHRLTVEETLKAIAKFNPDCIAIPLYTQSLTEASVLSNAIKDRFSHIPLIFGGPHPTVSPDDTFKHFPVDIIVRGEGEINIINLIDAIKKDKPLKGIKGISFRNSKTKKIIHNKDEKVIMDLDSIPIPSRDYIDHSVYYSKLSKTNLSDVIITSRGCPYRCIFCEKKTEASRIYRERSPENVVEELRLIAEKKVKAVEIFDDLFTRNRKRCIEILNMLRKENLDFEFRIRTRANTIDNELLDHLKKNGCSTISYGVESGNQRILNLNKKGTTIPMIEQAFKKTKKRNIKILGYFIFGLLGDTPETMTQTIKFAKKLDPYYGIFAKLIPWPGTEVYKIAKKDKTLVGKFAPGEPTPYVKLPWVNSEADLNRWVRNAYRTFYYRPKFVYNVILENMIKEWNWNHLSYLLENFYKQVGYQQDITSK